MLNRSYTHIFYVLFYLQVFYLIFCRSVWYFPLRLDSQLYVQVLFNQIAPDYLEGLLLVLPFGQLPQELLVNLHNIIKYKSFNFLTLRKRKIQENCFSNYNNILKDI